MRDGSVTCRIKSGVVAYVVVTYLSRECKQLLDMGVDGILTDAPTVLRSVLDGRD